VGDAEVMGELFASFGLAMLTGVLCIYIVLVLLFKDFLHPVTILCGAAAVAGRRVRGPADRAEELFHAVAHRADHAHGHGDQELHPAGGVRHRGAPRPGHEPLGRLLDACHKRARPIIMTTIAMGAGMLPIAIGWGAADPSFRSPMAVAVIGGLITSTVLSLLVVPVVFTYLTTTWS
jgi:multidrug efflux pump subunit AcrB